MSLRFREEVQEVLYEQAESILTKGNTMPIVGLTVIGTKLAYDGSELRRLANKKNLFGRYGLV